MIACVEMTATVMCFLSTYRLSQWLSSINYSLLVDPDLIGPWLQQFWATASLKVINDVPHIRAKVAGKKILISEATIRADLLFDDENGVDCFPKQVIWDLLRDIGYEGNLAQLTFSKPLFSPQWKYLVHVLLHCLSPKSTSWEQFGTNIASALVGLATNQKFNFSLMIMNGMLGHISNGTPFLMYPRAASSARDAQGTPSQSTAQGCISRYCDVHRYLITHRDDSLQSTAGKLGGSRSANPFKANRFSKLKAKLKKSTNSSASGQESCFLKSKKSEVLEEKVIETEEINIEEKKLLMSPSSPTQSIQVMELWKKQLKVADSSCCMSRPREIDLHQIRALEIQMLRRLQEEKIQAEWDAEKKKRYKDLQKLKYPPCDEGNCMTKFKLLLKDYFKYFIPWARKGMEMLMKISGKGLLRKKATISDEQASKKPKKLQVIDSPDETYIFILRAIITSGFDLFWEILHILDRQDHVAEKDNLFDAKTKNVQRSVYQEIAFKQIVNKMLLKDEA
ncbi:hypothetical protein Tco_0045962 [Tanacetum coccineum]